MAKFGDYTEATDLDGSEISLVKKAGATQRITKENERAYFHEGLSLGDLDDVDLESPAPSDDDVLVYEASSPAGWNPKPLGHLNVVPPAAPATNAVGYLGAPQNLALDSGNAAPALADCGKHFYHTDANARDFTIPANGSVAFPIGTVLLIINENGAAVVTIKITTDTLRWGSSTGQRALAANGSATLIKTAAQVWRLTGDGIT